MQYIHADPVKMRKFGTQASEFRNAIREQCEMLREATAALGNAIDERDMQAIRALSEKIETAADSAEPLLKQLNSAVALYADYVEKAKRIAAGGGTASSASSSSGNDGKTSYLDDNGNVYRVGNELLPNSEYDINGYHYTTDDQGRIASAEGKLRLKNRDKRLPIKDSIESIGKGDQLPGDDRGHLIGDQFDGSNGLENMIPQNSDINQKDFRSFENELAAEVKNGRRFIIKLSRFTMEPPTDRAF
ncbi:MAG: DNA/RNA non-specific endonuclease [Clostridia bacterium]|nr:DNA/RNA non-specific endonuclease [Clostridia bacterium]